MYQKFIEKSTRFNRTYGIMYNTYTCTYMYIHIYVKKILNQLPSVGLSQARLNSNNNT